MKLPPFGSCVTLPILLLAASSAFSACGDRGGPGYRAPDGRCVSWADLERKCGNPPTTRCTPEMADNAPKAVVPGAQLLTPSIPPPAGALRDPNLTGGSVPTGDRYAAPTPLFAGDLIGQASIIDGDTLEIHGNRIRLFGIDAPESTQFCRGEDSLPFRCGAKAANNLKAFIAQRPVTCVPVSLDRYGRTIATCSVAGIDLADWLVRNGWAVDWPQYSKGAYAQAQMDAQMNERGMWTGSFVMPWQFRACLRDGGRAGKCSDETR